MIDALFLKRETTTTPLVEPTPVREVRTITRTATEATIIPTIMARPTTTAALGILSTLLPLETFQGLPADPRSRQ